MIDKIIEYKNRISILKGLSEENIKTIIKDCHVLKFDKGEEIIHQGDDTKNVFFLIEGDAKVIVKDKEVGSIKPKQAFGELSVISNQKRNATVIANETCMVISFLFAMDILNKHHSAFADLYKNICNELIIKLDNANKRNYQK